MAGQTYARGLLRASFIPPVEFRQLRLVARQTIPGIDTPTSKVLRCCLVEIGADMTVFVSAERLALPCTPRKRWTFFSSHVSVAE